MSFSHLSIFLFFSFLIFFSSQTQNFECSEGAGQKCIKCSSDLKKCELCYQGYFFDKASNACKPCAENCNTCTGSSFKDCLFCKNSYFKSSASCEKCAEGCAVCNGPNKENCLSCPPRTYNSSSLGVCLNCPEGCKKCTGSTFEDCEEVEEGYYYNKDLSKLKRCSDDIHKCTKCSSRDKCEQCEEGYYYLDDNFMCATCTTISGCKKCLRTSAGDVCYEPRKYYCLERTQNSTEPVLCPENCEYCDEGGMCSGKCRKCKDGYYVNSDGSCSKCLHRDCLQCEASGRCLKCKETHTLLADGTCLFCENVAHCKECTKYPLVCGICEDKFTISESNGGCLPKERKKEAGDFVRVGFNLIVLLALTVF